MQDSSAGVQRQLSIGKKKGGFLFANAPEKTPEDLRREEEDRQRQEQELLERQHAAPAAPSNIPLATLGSYKEEDQEDSMATASSLKERLKQYQSLKAEQENAAKGISTDSNSFLGPPIDKPESAEVNQDEETKDERPPGTCTELLAALLFRLNPRSVISFKKNLGYPEQTRWKRVSLWRRKWNFQVQKNSTMRRK